MSDDIVPRTGRVRLATRLEDWPEPDRRAWAAGTDAGDILEPGGAGAAWAPATREGIVTAYGRWLRWLARTAQLDPGMAPADRVTPDAIVAYVTDLRDEELASTSILGNIRFLSRALKAMAPDRDWRWLRRVVANLKRAATPARNKRERVVPVGELLNFGIEVMVEADGPSGGKPFQRASRFMDGLIIAVLAARPVRRSNFAMIEIGKHLIHQSDGYWLRFDADETKTKVPIDLPFPAMLVPYLERYLTHHRPVLAKPGKRPPRSRAYTAPGQFLWVSTHHTRMSDEAIYYRVTKLTETKFGRALNPHIFRDCAATSVATEDPEHVAITRSILGHTTLATSESCYNQANSLAATRLHQDLILAVRRDSGLGNRRKA